MSYKIEINADSISELAGKLLAMAAQMQVTPVDPVMPEVREAPKPKKAKPAPVKEDDGVALTAAAHPVNEKASPLPVDMSPEALEEVEIERPEEPEQAPGAKALNFEKDVAPLVLEAVKVKGKPWVQDILSQFGVERASLVPDAQMPELVAAIRDGMPA